MHQRYKSPTKLRFIKTDQNFCGSTLVAIKVNIKKLIAFNEDHFLSLHAERYENVKNAIAKGEIDMPIIILSNDGLPYVDDVGIVLLRYKSLAFHHWRRWYLAIVDTIKQCF